MNLTGDDKTKNFKMSGVLKTRLISLHWFETIRMKNPKGIDQIIRWAKTSVVGTASIILK